MNTAFNSALKQSTSIRKDLTTLTTTPPNPDALTPAAIGTLSSSLTSFSRTLDEYSALTKQELSVPKQEKAQERLRNFRLELTDYRAQFATLKAAKEEALQANNRNELLGRRPYVSATPENPYASTPATTATSMGGGSYRGPSGGDGGGGGGGGASFGTEDERRENHALREQHFFSNTNNALDEYIMRGQAVLGNLGEQRDMLKGTQKRLYSVANTLGVSGDTIRMIERRARQDKWIFYVGVVVFLLFCWACLHFLR